MRRSESPTVSVVLCTYNRAESLAPAVEALIAQADGVDYEVIVVDNNSSDATARVVHDLAARSDDRVRYVFEARQGLSHARNRGIDTARAPIIAFTDDDVRVARDWVVRIAAAFGSHPDVDYVGGRVLPRWLQPPPRWLTTAHWSPLALQDYGNQRFVSGRDHAICLVGANLAFKRRVFDRIGRFTPELGRVKDGIGSTEDHDIQLRIWQAGMTGLYDPAIVVHADVTPDRMVKAYHRRWHRGHGRHCAAMRLRERVPADMGAMSEPQDLVMLFGSPAFVYAEIPRLARWWVRALIRGEDTFFYANKLRHVWSYLRTRRKMQRMAERRPLVSELVTFSNDLLRKRLRKRLAARPA